MTNRLLDKVAVVTGVGSDIGREIALMVANEGAFVVVNDFQHDQVDFNSCIVVDRVVEEIRSAGGIATPSYTDPVVMEGGESVINLAVDTYGRLDVLVNCISVSRDKPIQEMTYDDFDRVINTNLKGVFVPIKYASIQFRQQNDGKIVNVIPDFGCIEVGRSNYEAGLEALVGLTRTVARDMGKYNVTCNAVVAKTFVESPELKELQDVTCQVNMLGSVESTDVRIGYGSSNDCSGNVAPFVVYLCTSANSNINGHVFGISNGSICLYSDPSIDKSVHKWGGFSLNDLDFLAPRLLIQSF